MSGPGLRCAPRRGSRSQPPSPHLQSARPGPDLTFPHGGCVQVPPKLTATPPSTGQSPNPGVTPAPPVRPTSFQCFQNLNQACHVYHLPCLPRLQAPCPLPCPRVHHRQCVQHELWGVTPPLRAPRALHSLEGQAGWLQVLGDPTTAPAPARDAPPHPPPGWLGPPPAAYRQQGLTRSSCAGGRLPLWHLHQAKSRIPDSCPCFLVTRFTCCGAGRRLPGVTRAQQRGGVSVSLASTRNPRASGRAWHLESHGGWHKGVSGQAQPLRSEAFPGHLADDGGHYTTRTPVCAARLSLAAPPTPRCPSELESASTRGTQRPPHRTQRPQARTEDSRTPTREQDSTNLTAHSSLTPRHQARITNEAAYLQTKNASKYRSFSEKTGPSGKI
ncbi:uncharacterized protein LOC121497967 [Vulpes lagopus]|uniref:uncharacterized protein LOC121497967 n=1 Tax=Vulpes lagopus TaxID=494514 RepID=UPI001BC996F9|nr:uncharacterized protein LOC121497967 [Vulpes lagopus]XP_041623792.1 uncharacterized protein LOC121497967 [Vulpes lagopus]XP_041623793.1 uncharacterized protein LOC121497967 [Vulpes lagopus]